MSTLEFTDKELAAIREVHCAGATDAQFDAFISECKLRNLIPGTHLLFQTRAAKEWDPVLKTKVTVKKMTLVTRIDAFRLIAQRTGQYAGQDEVEYIYLDENHQPTIVSTIPLPDPKNPRLPREPWAARASVYRTGFVKPITVTARFDAYAQTFNTADGVQLTEMWRNRGSEQLSKCAEALALRKGFAEELGGVYIQEEFDRDRDIEPPAEVQPPTPVTPAPQPLAIPAVNHAPVEPKAEPRPEEPKPAPEPGPSAEPVQNTDENPDRPPTAEETKEVQARIRALPKGVDRNQVKDFILLRSGAKEVKAVLKAQWDAIFAELKAAGDENGLKALIHNALNPKKEGDDAQK